MRKIYAIAIKELRQVRRDPLSLLMLLGLPAFMLVLYGFALNFDVRHVPLAVQDLDKSRASRELVSSFVNSTYFDITGTPEAGADLERIIERRHAKAVLVIPTGYGEMLANGRRAPVQLLLDGTDATTATTILGYAGAIVAESNATLAVSPLQSFGEPGSPSQSFGRSGLPSQSVGGPEAIGNFGAVGVEPVITYEPRVWYNPELKSTQFLVPGLIALLLMLTAVLSTALSVVREKERGSFEQLRVAPIGTVQLIVGKTVPYLAISLAATLVILVAARLLFGVVVRGPYIDLLVATLLYLTGALGLGLLISTIVDSQSAAFQIGMLTSMLPAILLSGFIFPIRSMPQLLQWITLAVPARYYLEILRGIILKGSDLTPFRDQIGMLVLFASITLGLASLRLARHQS